MIKLTTALWQERERLGLTVDEVATRSGLRIDHVEAIDNKSPMAATSPIPYPTISRRLSG